MTKYTIEVSDSALMHLCIAGLESYVVPKKSKETYGLLWGSETRRRNDEVYYRVDHVFTDIEAKRRSDWVQYNEKGLRLKQEILDARWPTYTFLGDFHTHPCNKLSEIRQTCRLSEGDRRDVEENNHKFWMESNIKTNLVLTIAKLKDVGWSEPKRLKSNFNIVEWTLHDIYRMRLAAYVIDSIPGADGSERLFLSPCERKWRRRWAQAENLRLPRHPVWLDIPSVLGSSNFNMEW